MKLLLLFIIELYQKYVSPYKGFSCAHRVYFGGSPCSVYGKKAILKCGSAMGLKLILRRFRACSAAMQRMEKENPKDENQNKKRDKNSRTCLIIEGVECCSVLSIFG